MTPSPSISTPDQRADHAAIRQLFDEYLTMYASRDDRLTERFSDDFSGFTGGGDFLVKNRAEWVAITRQDFAQVKDPLRIELKDVSIQSLAETIAVATGFFVIHLPFKDEILSRETARLVLIFRKESAGWKISHSSISIPYHLVRAGEVYPLQELSARNQSLENLVEERTAQLQESESRYRSILNASPDDITITDLAGSILMFSPAAYAMFGYDRAAVATGRSVVEFVVPEDRDRTRLHMKLRLQGQKSGPTEYRGLRADGSSFPIEVNSEFIRDPNGVPTGVVVIIRDITERKQAEAEREKLELQTQQLQKTESLGRMAGAIAHTFNNQLHAVILGLDLTLRDQPANVAPPVGLTIAMNAARKAAEVSSQMLTYLGQTANHPEVQDLSGICSRCLPMLRAVIPPNAILATAFPEPGPVVSADSAQVQHVLTNLVTNAWEAAGASGSTIAIRVTTGGAGDISRGHRFPVEWQPTDGNFACLEVRDTGCGIAAQDIGKVFDPFFSTKFAGRGLGLAIVLGIVRAHHGGITVESETGRGSIFRVWLPRAQAP